MQILFRSYFYKALHCCSSVIRLQDLHKVLSPHFLFVSGTDTAFALFVDPDGNPCCSSPRPATDPSNRELEHSKINRSVCCFCRQRGGRVVVASESNDETPAWSPCAAPWGGFQGRSKYKANPCLNKKIVA